ncbi:MAG TPA: acylglycerol kinase family protein [Patescibacteria group bacterium]|nr:acylglycerol kinase family protein [Patescibacteria group bacterium]
MYIYIYDAIAGKRKYNKILAKMEKKITDLGLNGKIVRLEGINNIEKTIQDEIKYEANTVVAVGSDQTVHKTLNAVIKERDRNPQKELPVLGVIPLEEKNNLIAKALGLKTPDQACNALLSRRIEKLGVGKINQDYFLSQLDVIGDYNEIKIGEEYSIEIQKPCEISIINLPLSSKLARKIKTNFKDKNLKLYINPRKTPQKKQTVNQSILSLKSLFITDKTQKIVVDNSIEVETEASVSSCDKKLNFIVGKDRNF